MARLQRKLLTQPDEVRTFNNGRLEIFSGKWRHQDFDKMLADLMRIAAALPFSAALPAAP